jgi:hypothetical protein
VDVEQEKFVVMDGQKILKTLPIQGLRGAEMDFLDFFKHIQQEAYNVDWHYQTLWQK